MNEFIVELIVRSLILASLGLVVRFAFIRSSAQSRARVLALTMVCLAAMPLAMLLFPRMQVVVGSYREVEAPISDRVSSVAMAPSTPDPATFPWGWVLAVTSVILVAKVVFTLIRFRKLELGLSPASTSLSDRVKSLTSKARIVFLCPKGEPPMTWGMIKPKIAMPEESENWIEPQFRSVVLHEDAHIQRKDWAVSIGFRFVAAFYWFNPLVWALKALFEQDSERAADDCVLAQGVDSTEYAQRIVEVAKALRPQAGKLPTLAMARNARLKRRLGAILSSRTSRSPMAGWKKVMVAGFLAMGALAAGLIVPTKERIVVKLDAPSSLLAKTPPPTSPTLDSDSKDISAPNAMLNVPDVKFDSSKIDTAGNSVSMVSNANASDKKLAEGCTPSPVTAQIGKPRPVSDSQKEIDDANQDLNDAMKEVRDSMAEMGENIDRETKQAIKDAQREAEQQIESAKKEIEKAGMSHKDKKLAKASLEFAKGIAGLSIKMATEVTKNLKIDPKIEIWNEGDEIDPDSKSDKGKKPKNPSTDKDKH